MELPKRSLQHISESRSYKIFRNNIPDHWIVREITERDYGIDCYVELVNNKFQLTGDLISFQIKSKSNITWNRNDNFKIKSINESTVNYWYKFAVPVVICLVDLTVQKVYFLSLKKYIREHFDLYLNESKMPFLFNKKNELSQISEALIVLLREYYLDSSYEILCRDIISFVSNYHSYKVFLNGHIGRDYFLGLERETILYLQQIYDHLKYLCMYFEIEWDLDDFGAYKVQNENYDLYEAQASTICSLLFKKLKPLFLKIQHHVCEKEPTYWSCKNNVLSNFLYNISDESEILGRQEC